MEGVQPRAKRPWAVEFRSSVWFCTFVVFLTVLVDFIVYAIIIPVIPFRLEKLGYRDPSALTGWLLVVYSLGLLLATPPLAFLTEKYWSRRTPLIFAIILLIGTQIMFMEAKHFWLMCIARGLQGIASATVWVVAFSLLCDTVPEERLGQQIGVVLMALTLGFLISPPVGGVLNDKIGYRAPFVLGIILCFVDLAGRLLVIEKHEAERWISPPETAEGETNGQGDNAPAADRERTQLSVIKVVLKLCRSKRAATAFLNVFIYGMAFTMLEPTLPLRLQAVYGFTSLKVGIVYLAAVVPSIFSTPLSGWVADKIGQEWVTVGCLLASVPWWALLAIRGPLALFIISLALGDFFIAAVITPVTADLAAAARGMEGIGYAHVFGAFNFAYSIASVVGPLISGQVYTHVNHGWTILMVLSSGLMLFAAIIAAYGAGERPLWTRFIHRSSKPVEESNTVTSTPATVSEKGPSEV